MDSVAWRRLFVLVALVVLGMLCSALVSAAIFAIGGFETSGDAFDALADNDRHRLVVRLSLISGHVFGFILPAVAYSFLFYRPRMADVLRSRWRPTPAMLFWALLFLLVAYPLVGWLAQINLALPFPDGLMEVDQRTFELMTGILTMNSPAEFLLNLFLIAVIPAIGEEWLFRGILQNEVERLRSNVHIAVWITALIFGAFHLQIQSFFPKVALGAILGYAYVWTRNFWVPVILHFINNATQVCVLYFMDIDMTTMEQSPEGAISWWMLLVSALTVFLVAEQLKKHASPTSENAGT